MHDEKTEEHILFKCKGKINMNRVTDTGLEDVLKYSKLWEIGSSDLLDNMLMLRRKDSIMLL
jgi:hypothetical protein